MTKLNLKVTQEDINTGVPGDGNFCAISEAFKRTGWDYVEIDDQYGYLEKEDPDEYFSFPLTPFAKSFIYAYDEGLPVTPCEFDFELETGERYAIGVDEFIIQFPSRM